MQNKENLEPTSVKKRNGKIGYKRYKENHGKQDEKKKAKL